MRKKSLFNKKIICGYCGGSFKSKTGRKNIKFYVCSKHDNFGTCQRVVVYEEKLVSLINKRYQRELDENEIKEKVIEIIIKNKLYFDIVLKDDKPISFHERGIIF